MSEPRVGGQFTVEGPDHRATWTLTAYRNGCWEAKPASARLLCEVVWTFSDAYVRRWMGGEDENKNR